jgi:hypothetical protein
MSRWRKGARRDGENYYLSSGALCGKRTLESIESAERGGIKKNTSIAHRDEKLLSASGGGRTAQGAADGEFEISELEKLGRWQRENGGREKTSDQAVRWLFVMIKI